MESLCRSITFLTLSFSLALVVRSTKEGVEEDWGVGDNVRVMMGYSDSWAVEVEGGSSEADRIAEENDFVNLGQVGYS